MLSYVKQALVNGTNIVGVEIPLGSVFGRFKPDARHDGDMYFYIVPGDIKAWYQNENSAFVYILIGNMKRFVRKCVSLKSAAWTTIKRWIYNNAIELLNAKTGCKSGDIAKQAPKERKVGKYILRGRPEHSGTMTQTSVTANSKIGSRRWSEEAYCVIKMGME